MYVRCLVCQEGSFPLDTRLGIDSWMSRRAQRLTCLAGASWSFDRAAEHLKEFCGLRVSDTTIRAVCQSHGTSACHWQQEAPEAASAFRQAQGDVELSTDGTSVNTTSGWREMRLSVFAKRTPGRPQTVARWQERNLPKPTARVVSAGLVRAKALGAQWRRWAGHLGLKQTAEITVLADGARWIWNQVERHLPQARGILDIYHASQHLYQTATVLHGEGTMITQRWVEARRAQLMRGGATALFEALAQDRRQTRSRRKHASLAALVDYFRPHTTHTGYLDRLRQGRTIGSGLVEGACKTVVSRRLKQTGARWRIRRVERMAALCCLLYGDQWNHYWSSRTA